MAIFYVFSIFFVIAITIEMWAMGKWMAKQNHIFGSYPLNSFLLGAVLWFFITFVTFFPFIWLNLGILYFVTIFSAKEVLLWFFLAARREDWFLKEDLKEMATVIFGGVVLTLINHYLLTKYTNTTPTGNQGEFHTWYILVAVLADITKQSNELVLAWPLAFIAGILVYSIVTTLTIMLSRSITWFEYIFSFVLSVIFVLLLSNGVDFATSLGTWFGIFAFYLATQVILKSRRRFAVFFAITFIASWSIQPDVYIAYAGLAIVTTLVYTFLKKSKVYLFWVQLVAPLAIIGSLYVYELSAAAAIFMVIGTIFAYIFMLTYVKAEAHAKLNLLFIKTRIILPVIMICAIFMSGMGFIIRDKPTIYDLFIFEHGIFDNFTNYKGWSVFNVVASCITFVALVVYQIYWKIMKKKMIDHRIFILLALSLVAFAYNPFFEISFMKTLSLRGFPILRNMTIIPIFIALSNKLKYNVWTKNAKEKLDDKIFKLK